METTPPANGPKSLTDAYLALGLHTGRRPGNVVNRRHRQVMVHLALIDGNFQVRPVAFWSDGTHIKVLDDAGEFHPDVNPSAELQITGGSGQVFDSITQMSRTSLERIEDVERSLAELEKDPLHAPAIAVLELKRKTATVRAELGRTISAVADFVEGRLLPLAENARAPLRTSQEELLRLRDMTQATQSALTDIFMIRQAEQANQLQLVANRMAAVSNRIAELSNISNIRMLGLSYVTLILAVVATVILFPNTAATILGMPSAADVSPMIVWAALAGTAVAPIAWFASQKWIRELFHGMSRYEARVSEGIIDLPENVPGVHPIPGESSPPGSPARNHGAGANRR